jgi:type IV pilus assembly protein PilY1
MAALIRLVRFAVLAALALLVAGAAQADDIDIFAGIPTDQDLPNVLIIWDNSANWSSSIPVANCSYDDGSGSPKESNPGKEQGTKMAIEKCAILNVIHALPTNADGSARFNVALMLFNESPAANSGGYPRQRFLPMTAANKTILKATIRNITIGGDKGNNSAFTKALHEGYLMFSKAAPYRGTAGTKWDHDAVAGSRYVGPPGNGCGRNHIIFLANGRPGEVTDNEARELLSGAGGNATGITYPSSLISNSDQGNWADEYTRFLRGVDIVGTKEGVQSVTTHGVAVVGASSDGLYPNFIRAMATQGGGQYYAASDITNLTKYLINIFNSIQATNSVFASASLPISSSAQGSYKNQVFVGVFRPDANARPRWVGNLKQYKIGYDRATDSMQLIDSEGSPALNSATGFFRPTAISYWTRDSEFFRNDPKGTPESISDRPDGEVVEKGGVAQSIRTLNATDQLARNLYTCIGCPASTSLPAATTEQFAASNTLLTREKFGVATDAERDALIAWVRGTDNAYDVKGPGGTTTVRPSVHGDVLHSRPAVVDYAGSTGTIVFYGSNDGFVRAIDGNQTGATAGRELWAFVPEEFLGKFKRFRDNLPEIRFPSTPASAIAVARDYFVDGPVTVYQKFNDAMAVEKAYLYVSMRRGGRLLYALDVTDPLAPRLMWKKTAADIAVLGQTWSEPRVARIKGFGNPVLVLGAGYDAAAEDALPPGTTTMGNAVLIIDSVNGTLLGKLDTARSVPASVALLDTDFDGFTDRAYAADTGGNVYRIDFESAGGEGGVGHWRISNFAALEGGAGRKFFYAPDVVHTNAFTAVMLGSGNRERPLATSTSDRFYTLFDYGLAKGTIPSAVIGNETLVPYSASFEPSSSVTGCYLPLETGEKVVTSSATTGGNSYFSTHRATPPSPDSCNTNLGVAKGYRAALFCGGVESVEFAGGGLPPSPVIGEVEVAVPDIGLPPGEGGETRKLPFVIGGYNMELSGLNVSRVPIKVDPKRKRTYWFNQYFK